MVDSYVSPHLPTTTETTATTATMRGSLPGSHTPRPTIKFRGICPRQLYGPRVRDGTVGTWQTRQPQQDDGPLRAPRSATATTRQNRRSGICFLADLLATRTLRDPLREHQCLRHRPCSSQWNRNGDHGVAPCRLTSTTTTRMTMILRMETSSRRTQWRRDIREEGIGLVLLNFSARQGLCIVRAYIQCFLCHLGEIWTNDTNFVTYLLIVPNQACIIFSFFNLLSTAWVMLYRV